METDLEMDDYIKIKLLDIEENAYRIGFIDGRKEATRTILDTISPIVAKDCLKDIIRMIRRIDTKDKFSKEINSNIIAVSYTHLTLPTTPYV